MSSENLLLNELIREYLEYNEHKHTLSTMIAGKQAPNLKVLVMTLRTQRPGSRASRWTESFSLQSYTWWRTTRLAACMETRSIVFISPAHVIAGRCSMAF